MEDTELSTLQQAFDVLIDAFHLGVEVSSNLNCLITLTDAGIISEEQFASEVAIRAPNMVTVLQAIDSSSATIKRELDSRWSK